MKRHHSGLYTATVNGLAAGSRYYYCLDGERLRDLTPCRVRSPEGFTAHPRLWIRASLCGRMNAGLVSNCAI